MTELDGSVLDILIYVFDRYMLDDGQDVPERDELAQNLEEVGFEGVKVERALDWLADLAGERDRPEDRAERDVARRRHGDGEHHDEGEECPRCDGEQHAHAEQRQQQRPLPVRAAARAAWFTGGGVPVRLA